MRSIVAWDRLGRFTTCGLMAVLAGCAGTIKQDMRVQGDVSKVEGVAQVVARMSPDATKLQADNPQFSRDEVANYLRRKLESKGLLAPGAPHQVDVVITDIRVRSAVTAVLFGVLAGNDHVAGKVQILDANGHALRSFDVDASYALGGWAGGQDSTRMNWLYDKFSELAAAELEKVVSAPKQPIAAKAQGMAQAAVPAPAAIATSGGGATMSSSSLPTAGIAIDDVNAVPGNDKTREWYRDFLSRRSPRAFVVADGGRCNYTWGTNPKDPMEPKDPLERAMKRCHDQGKVNCTPYAVDERVVYVKPEPSAQR